MKYVKLHKNSIVTPMSHRSYCRVCADRKQSEDSYTAFKKLMEVAHIDNMKVLKGMIRATDDQRPLYDGSKRFNVGSLLLPDKISRFLQLKTLRS